MLFRSEIKQAADDVDAGKLNEPAGQALMRTANCEACHKITEKSIGPAYTEVSKRYKDDSNAKTYLANKIMKGSVGVWGENPMPAHPNLKEEDALKISEWILTLSENTGHKE